MFRSGRERISRPCFRTNMYKSVYKNNNTLGTDHFQCRQFIMYLVFYVNKQQCNHPKFSEIPNAKGKIFL